jgi:hypothetical protein
MLTCIVGRLNSLDVRAMTSTTDEALPVRVLLLADEEVGGALLRLPVSSANGVLLPSDPATNLNPRWICHDARILLRPGVVLGEVLNTPRGPLLAYRSQIVGSSGHGAALTLSWYVCRLCR